MSDGDPAAAFVVPAAGWYSFNGGPPVMLTAAEVEAAREHMAHAVVVEFDTEPIDTAAQRQTAGMTEPLRDEDYVRLGRILERFIKQDGVTYWGVGEDNRPRVDGQEGGMTIDMSVTISEAEAALLDRVGEPW